MPPMRWCKDVHYAGPDSTSIWYMSPHSGPSSLTIRGTALRAQAVAIACEKGTFSQAIRLLALQAGSNHLDNVKDQKMEYRAPGALDFFPSIITSPFGGTRVHHCNSV